MHSHVAGTLSKQATNQQTNILDSLHWEQTATRICAHGNETATTCTDARKKTRNTYSTAQTTTKLGQSVPTEQTSYQMRISNSDGVESQLFWVCGLTTRYNIQREGKKDWGGGAKSGRGGGGGGGRGEVEVFWTKKLETKIRLKCIEMGGQLLADSVKWRHKRYFVTTNTALAIWEALRMSWNWNWIEMKLCCSWLNLVMKWICLEIQLSWSWAVLSLFVCWLLNVPATC